MPKRQLSFEKMRNDPRVLACILCEFSECRRLPKAEREREQRKKEAEEAKAKAEQRLEGGGDISEEEAKALTHAILYSRAQITAKRRKRG